MRCDSSSWSVGVLFIRRASVGVERATAGCGLAGANAKPQAKTALLVQFMDAEKRGDGSRERKRPAARDPSRRRLGKSPGVGGRRVVLTPAFAPGGPGSVAVLTAHTSSKERSPSVGGTVLQTVLSTRTVCKTVPPTEALSRACRPLREPSG